MSISTSQICFNAQGSRVLTASADKTARLWDVQSGVCLQVLEGHTDEIFSSAFNYEGDTIITGNMYLLSGLGSIPFQFSIKLALRKL